MRVQSNVRARLCGVAVLMALVAGCGGGGGGSADPGPSAPPSGPPAGPPPAAEVRGWANPFGSAVAVLGQSRFDQEDPEGGPATPFPNLNGAPALTSDGKLLVADNGNVYGFDSYDTANGPVADSEITLVHLGAAFAAIGLAIQGEKLVAATANDMILIYNEIPTAGNVPANATAGEGFGCDSTHLTGPNAAYLTPAGNGQRLIVADTFNHRVLIWFNVPSSGPAGPADRVLGQQGMNTCEANADGSAGRETLNAPSSVWSDGTKLIVADTGNNRVLIWNDISDVSDFQGADVVIGQQNFLATEPNRGQPTPSGITLSTPRTVDVSASGELAVTDAGNSRVLIWRAIPSSADRLPDFVVGQGDFFHGAANDINQTGVPGTALSAKTLRNPTGARFHGRNLIVNDGGNDRVLVWHESD